MQGQRAESLQHAVERGLKIIQIQTRQTRKGGRVGLGFQQHPTASFMFVAGWLYVHENLLHTAVKWTMTSNSHPALSGTGIAAV
jgi:hypothetical protein